MKNKLNELYVSFKKNKAADLVYRFLLWSSVAYVLNYLSLFSDGVRGAYVRDAISSLPSSSVPQLVAGLGLVLLIINVMTKELKLTFGGIFSLKYLFVPINDFLSKVSSDLILVGYSSMSFIVGWVTHFFVVTPTTADENKLIFMMIGFLVLLTAILGVLSLVARSDFDAPILAGWKRLMPAIVRWGVYLTLLSIIPWVFWYQ